MRKSFACKSFLALLVALSAAGTALAQADTQDTITPGLQDGVTMSTDPARAEEVLRHAEALRQQQANGTGDMNDQDAMRDPMQHKRGMKSMHHRKHAKPPADTTDGTADPSGSQPR